MRDYLRASDFAHLSEEAIALHDDDTANGERILYFDDKLLRADGGKASSPSGPR